MVDLGTECPLRGPENRANKEVIFLIEAIALRHTDGSDLGCFGTGRRMEDYVFLRWKTDTIRRNDGCRTT